MAGGRKVPLRAAAPVVLPPPSSRASVTDVAVLVSVGAPPRASLAAAAASSTRASSSSATSSSSSSSSSPSAPRALDPLAVKAALSRRLRLVGTGPLGWSAPRFELGARDGALAEPALGLPRDALVDAVAACNVALEASAPRLRGAPRMALALLVVLGGISIYLFAPKSDVDEQPSSQSLPRNATIGMSVIVCGALLAVLLYVQLRRGNAGALAHVRMLLGSEAFQARFVGAGYRLNLHERQFDALACWLALVAHRQFAQAHHADVRAPAAAALAGAARKAPAAAAAAPGERAAAEKAAARGSEAESAPAAAAAPPAKEVAGLGRPAPPAAAAAAAAEEERAPPVRPLSAYQSYVADFKRTDAWLALPGNAAARLQAVAGQWRELDEAARGAYVRQAAEQLVAYKAEGDEYARWAEARAEAQKARGGAGAR